MPLCSDFSRNNKISPLPVHIYVAEQVPVIHASEFVRFTEISVLLIKICMVMSEQSPQYLLLNCHG